MNWWQIDETHDPDAPCWIADAVGHSDFPIQNLPLGIFSYGDGGPRAGVAIGNWIFDLAGAVEQGLLPSLDGLSDVLHERLNELLALGAGPRQAIRHALFALFSDKAHEAATRPFLVPMAEADLHLPCDVGDYSDFYAGIHHALNVGRQFRPDNPLLPNYRHVPIGYHGRASSIILSGTPVTRPHGQISRPSGPSLAPTERLDLELELGIWVGSGNMLGHPIPIEEAAEHVGGFCLLNDWSARDIQTWEYQPLGPFLAKSFATTLSPWIITPEALAPFRSAQAARTEDDPSQLPYLLGADDQAHGALALDLGIWIETPAMREAGIPEFRLSATSSSHLYWTVGQLLAHHSVNGCNLRPGDLIGTGTISGPELGSEGSLLELSQGGQQPIELPNGEQRTFLLAGDRLRISAHGRRDGFATIGFGECWAEILG